jgi:hypothetical protein
MFTVIVQTSAFEIDHFDFFEAAFDLALEPLHSSEQEKICDSEGHRV